ncbi:hypothetical protein GCM10009102_30420 [Sphingomonas insulae]|uniref:Uncharacterized protein n=1 Tax=Sphingomonas insulae TaxID=424800 RepID=A0ABP3T2S2_9SPHN
MRYFNPYSISLGQVSRKPLAFRDGPFVRFPLRSGCAPGDFRAVSNPERPLSIDPEAHSGPILSKDADRGTNDRTLSCGKARIRGWWSVRIGAKVRNREAALQIGVSGSESDLI